MENDNYPNGAVSQRTTCRDYSRKMHFAEQDAWNLPTNKKSSFSAKPSSSGEPSALLEIKSHAMYSILRGGATPFRFSLSLSFLSLVVLVINLSDFFLIKLSNGKKKKNCSLLLTAYFCLNKIYCMKLCQSKVQIHAPIKKPRPALPGGEDIQLRWKI